MKTKPIPAGNSPDFKGYFILFFSFIGVIALSVYGVVYFFQQQLLVSTLYFFYSFVIALNFVGLQKHKNNRLTGLIALVILHLVMVSILLLGGVGQTALIWMPMFPVLLFALEKSPVTWLWIVFYMLTIPIVKLIASLLGLDFVYTDWQLIQLFSALLVESTLLASFAYSHERHLKYEQDLVKELNQVNQRLSQELRQNQQDDKRVKSALSKTAAKNEFLEDTRRAMLNMLEDLEKEKQASEVSKQEIKQQKERFDIALKAAKIGTWSWNTKTNTVDWDEMMYQLHGVETGSFSGTVDAYFEFVHPEDVQELKTQMRVALQNHQELNTSYRVIRPDGSVRYIGAVGKLISQSDQSELMVGINLDQTKEKLFEADLKKFEMAVESSSDHIVITDPDGIILYANPAVEKTTGYDRHEIIGNTPRLWGGLMDQSYYQRLWKTVKEKKQVFSGEITNQRKSGIEYQAEVHISPVLDENEDIIYFVGIERDITQAKEVDKMKNEFISLASHQLRTPLSAIKWFIEMLLAGDAGELNEEQMQFLHNIDESNERMIDLINGLLNISRIESGRIIIDPKPTDLKGLVHSVVAELQPSIEEKEHTFSLEVSDEVGEVNIDPRLIRQVYINLFSNAIKYTPAKGSISVNVKVDGEMIRTDVFDTGRGIPTKDHQHVFEKFFRADNIIKEVTEGTGLGLYLVKAIVESSGGLVAFESKEGEGSHFWFTIPLAGMEPQEGEVSIAE